MFRAICHCAVVLQADTTAFRADVSRPVLKDASEAMARFH
jgi:hypothetical protein